MSAKNFGRSLADIGRGVFAPLQPAPGTSVFAESNQSPTEISHTLTEIRRGPATERRVDLLRRAVEASERGLSVSLDEVREILRAGSLRDVLAIAQEMDRASGRKTVDSSWKQKKDGSGDLTHYVDDDGKTIELDEATLAEMKEAAVRGILHDVERDPLAFHRLCSDPAFPYRIRESLALLTGVRALGYGEPTWPDGATPRQVMLHLGAYLRRYPDYYERAIEPSNPDWQRRPDLDVVLRSARAWASCGFPSVQPSHRLAAALMATWVPPECASDVASPWPFVLFTIPDGLGLRIGGHAVSAVALMSPTPDAEPRSTVDGPRGPYYFLHLFPGEFGDGDDYDETQLLVHLAPFRSIEELAGGSASVLPFEPGGPYGGLAVPEGDAPSLDLVCRLVVNCLIELSESPEHRRRIQAGPPRADERPNKVATGRGRGRGGVEPSAWVFAVTRDVRHDLRDWVREYASGGGGRSPRVQCLVRGHRRRQVCGRGRLERKTIWIEPFWRGGEDLPVAVREHVLDRVRRRDRAERMDGTEAATEKEAGGDG